MAKKDAPKVLDLTALTARTRNQFNAIRSQFKAFAAQTAKWRETLDDFAPKVMAVYNAMASEANEQGIRFRYTDFVRMLDPSLPAHRDPVEGKIGYRDHKAYQAFEYIRRKMSSAERGEGRARREERPTKGNPLVRFARLLKTFLPLVRDEQQVWTAVKAEFGLNDEQEKKLRAFVASDAIPPLLQFAGARTMQATVLHFTPPTRTEQPAEEQEQPAPARGRKRRAA